MRKATDTFTPESCKLYARCKIAEWGRCPRPCSRDLFEMIEAGTVITVNTLHRQKGATA